MTPLTPSKQQFIYILPDVSTSSNLCLLIVHILQTSNAYQMFLHISFIQFINIHTYRHTQKKHKKSHKIYLAIYKIVVRHARKFLRVITRVHRRIILNK